MYRYRRLASTIAPMDTKVQQQYYTSKFTYTWWYQMTNGESMYELLYTRVHMSLQYIRMHISTHVKEPFLYLTSSISLLHTRPPLHHCYVSRGSKEIRERYLKNGLSKGRGLILWVIRNWYLWCHFLDYWPNKASPFWETIFEVNFCGVTKDVLLYIGWGIAEKPFYFINRKKLSIEIMWHRNINCTFMPW